MTGFPRLARRAPRRRGRPGAGGALLDLFGLPGFAGLWLSASAGAFARLVIMLALSWVTLESTESPFLVGVVMAARMAPLLLFGLPAGAATDTFDRRALIIAANGGAVLTALAAATAAGSGRLDLPSIILAAVTFGALDTLRTAATQASVYDLARAARAGRALALTNLGAQLLGALGAVVGGYALEGGGASRAFLVVALAALLGALGPAVGPVPSARPSDPPRSRPEPWRALTLLGRNRLVAVLALAIILAEALGFSHMTLLPTFARDVFEVGAAGLGALTAARSIGGVVGLLLLARLGTGDHSGRLFLLTGGAFGLGLVAFAALPSFELALALLVLVGAVAATQDSLSQTLIQRNVADHERGAAMGVWIFSVGFAPLGHLALGALAGAFGAPPAQALSGAALVLVILGLGLHAPLRRAP